ncbi:RICIN domain-containing protein [Sphingomonas soli]|uniref:RICIN domain-containing protein n=1 Tax=Sphingomonas soli TaxID=266127 RepID=UPI00082AED40|nr:RICIN domain-containing protein [Sphingomonas soli]
MFRKCFILAAVAAAAAASPAGAQVSVQASGGMPAIVSYYATGSCLDVGNANVIMIAACNASRGAQGWRFVSGGYGMISLGNQTCLTANGSGQPLTAAQCANTPNQRWGFQGSGELRNETGVCADIEGGSRASGARVVGWSCHGGLNQKWYQGASGARATFRISASTPLTTSLRGRALIASSGPSQNNIVAGGAGNIVAGGAGNIVAGGAGNIVAGGAGNLIVQGIVAGGAGNLIANDGTSLREIAASQFR